LNKPEPFAIHAAMPTTESAIKVHGNAAGLVLVIQEA
jgi:hypothetical protein